jgi:TPR repeat protein
MVEVMQQQGDDPRALLIGWKLKEEESIAELRRAAEMGYAPAQARLSTELHDDVESLRWAEKAALQGERRGLYLLGSLVYTGVPGGCEKDEAKGLELMRQSAELGYSVGPFLYGKLAFGETDWDRYYWWGRGALRGNNLPAFIEAILDFIPAFQRGECGRILHTVTPVLQKTLHLVNDVVFDGTLAPDEFGDFHAVIFMHQSMLDRARAAIACWSVVGLRCGVVKDVRVLIAKMLWEEPWLWSKEQEEAAEADSAD